MSFYRCALLLPFVLGLHNAEEYSRFNEFTRVYQSGLAARFRTRRVVQNAMVLLTLSSAVLGVLTFACRTPLLIRLSEVAVFALMLNSLGHVIASARQRALTPGTLSAAVVVLPYCLLATAGMGETWVSFLLLAVAGAAVMPAAAALHLAAGYGISQLQSGRR